MAAPVNITAVPPPTSEKVTPVRHSAEELKKIKKVCADFESLFTYELLKTMRKTIPETKIGTSNYGKDTYTLMMDQKLAETISSDGRGLGLQKVLYDQLTNTRIKELPVEVTGKLK